MRSGAGPAPGGAAKKTKKTSSIRKFIFTVIKFLVVFFIVSGSAVAGIAGGAIYAYIKTAEPIRDDQLANILSYKTTFIYDSKGNVIQKLTGKDSKDSEPITDKEAPKFLKDAIISIEDERFETHHGIDLKRILSAGIIFFTHGEASTHGASTITQQVVKNITGNTRRSLQRKVQEWYEAILLERKLEKWQILEIYMNISYWGHGCYGVQSASKKYFGKPVQELSLAQCALLAGITNYPAKYDPFTEKGRENAKKRQEIILNKMLELGKISKSQYDEAIVEDLKYASPDQSKKLTSVQSYFVDQVIIDVRNQLMKDFNMSSAMANYMIYNGGLEIYTTMDPSVQAAMDQVFTDDEYFPLVNPTAKRQMEHPQAAMVIIDAQNGQVKALYGGYGVKTASNTLNRASSTLMKRQPGSSIKPIAVYAPAIDLKLITPATIIDDVPVYMDEKNPDKEYPRNYDNLHDGLTSVRNGLKNSVNVVAAKIWMDLLGPDNSIEYLKRVGINRENEKYLSLVMGGLEQGVNPEQMAAAYVPFVHKGMYYEPTTFTLVKDNTGKTLISKKPVYHTAYSEQTAFIMRDLMKEVTEGIDSPYPHPGTAAKYVNEKIIGMPVAGKTGTTSSNIDKWFVGYTPYYTAAVWYGYDNNGSEPITLRSDEYNQAMKIWAAVMKKVSSGMVKKDFDPQPPGIVQKEICIYSGKVATPLCKQDPRGNATRTEYFIKGTEPRDDDPCDVHVQAQVCTESKDVYGRNLLAGQYCPPDKVLTRVFIRRKSPYVPLKPGESPPKDVIYELPAGEYCNLHGGPATFGTGSATTAGSGSAAKYGLPSGGNSVQPGSGSASSGNGSASPGSGTATGSSIQLLH